MKTIRLSNGRQAKVDNCDFKRLMRFRWFPCKSANTTYALRNVIRDGHRSTLSMHRMILGEPPILVDHRNGDGLDNRRQNLRKANGHSNV